ncbi:unnamed protein product [Trifolium pratense]|uniref:Uncharacterized protein n=1 Tax=Trifolium pratense TaxID=57577 RepID=A0ACB0J4M4_TRIPR|nr:unnamed protein product [Trifolium pratense]
MIVDANATQDELISTPTTVKIKIKSKHIGGAFSKKSKCVVYGVCNEDSAWPYQKEREASKELYFGLKTAQGLLEFKSESKLQKQKWVDGTLCTISYRLRSCLDAI